MAQESPSENLDSPDPQPHSGTSSSSDPTLSRTESFSRLNARSPKFDTTPRGSSSRPDLHPPPQHRLSVPPPGALHHVYPPSPNSPFHLLPMQNHFPHPHTPAAQYRHHQPPPHHTPPHHTHNQYHRVDQDAIVHEGRGDHSNPKHKQRQAPAEQDESAPSKDALSDVTVQKILNQGLGMKRVLKLRELIRRGAREQSLFLEDVRKMLEKYEKARQATQEKLAAYQGVYQEQLTELLSHTSSSSIAKPSAASMPKTLDSPDPQPHSTTSSSSNPTLSRSRSFSRLNAYAPKFDPTPWASSPCPNLQPLPQHWLSIPPPSALHHTYPPSPNSPFHLLPMQNHFPHPHAPTVQYHHHQTPPHHTHNQYHSTDQDAVHEGCGDHPNPKHKQRQAPVEQDEGAPSKDGLSDEAMQKILNQGLGMKRVLKLKQLDKSVEQFDAHFRGTIDGVVQAYLNIFNYGSRDELTQLYGIGEKKVAAIIELRESSLKPFASLDDVEDVGISTKMLKKVLGLCS